ncbi:MAG: leucine--tRNA ligase [Candidatus Dasytiphilus stammeri]
MQDQYRPQEIEPYVQSYWKINKSFYATEVEDKEKYYCLSMLPYPSGSLHMGHVRNYTIGDVIARYQRMLGKNVLYPIGWDAFGLPAENAAIKNKTAPAYWTYSNIHYMKKQLQLLGFSYDWSRELITCHPEYYRWEQWFFIQLYKKGLVYRNSLMVNWCPKDQTVLANEQVVNGCCWRCDTKLETRKISQWFIRITAYADELLNGLKELKYWPKKVKTMQRNWIGRSEGIEITFSVIGLEEKITLYTTRPNTIMDVICIAIALNHPLALTAATSNRTLESFINKYRNIQVSEAEIATIEKVGMATGLFAIHPISNELLPILIVNFINFEYGTGSIMITYDQPDLKLATKYNLPIKIVIPENDSLINQNVTSQDQATTKTKIRTEFNSKNGMSHEVTCDEIIKHIIDKGIGKRKVNYRLRDWGVSRQRYWGAPIPMIIKNTQYFPVAEEDLPVVLPEDRVMDGVTSPLKTDRKWINLMIRGEPAQRETDTFDTFMESSWYYARYTCPHYSQGMLDPSAANYWLPIDQYIGGIEHAIMHLMYFRFYHKLLRDAGLVKSDEPAQRLLCQGMVLADAFYLREKNGERQWISPANVTITRDKTGKIIKAIDNMGRELVYAGVSKMSKSKNNGIDPIQMIERYGADTVRLFLMFVAPAEIPLYWTESGVEGCYRFLKRLWTLVYNHIKKGPTSPIVDHTQLDEQQKSLRYELHKTISKVTDDIDDRQTFNTAIAAIMELTNKLGRANKNSSLDRSILHEAIIAIVLMLYPFTPHICFVMWQAIHGKSASIDNAKWPQVDKEALIKKDNWIIVQINGRVRTKILVSTKATQEQIQQIAMEDKVVSKYMKGLSLHRTIYVADKLINLIVR